MSIPVSHQGNSILTLRNLLFELDKHYTRIRRIKQGRFNVSIGGVRESGKTLGTVERDIIARALIDVEMKKIRAVADELFTFGVIADLTEPAISEAGDDDDDGPKRKLASSIVEEDDEDLD